MSDSAALKSSTVWAPSAGAGAASGATADAANGSDMVRQAVSTNMHSRAIVRLGAQGSTIGRFLRRLSLGYRFLAPYVWPRYPAYKSDWPSRYPDATNFSWP